MIGPLTAFTLTVYVPESVEGEVDIVRMDDPAPPALSATVSGLNVTITPEADDDSEPVRETLPVRPVLPKISEAVEDPPATTLGGVTGPATIEKSASTMKVIVVTEFTEPLVPVIVMM